MTIERYPLTWPTGRPRTAVRRDSKFKASFSESMRRALNELKLLGARDVVISSTTPPKVPLAKKGGA